MPPAILARTELGTGFRRGSDRLADHKQLEMSRKFGEQAQAELNVARMLVQPGGYHAAAEHARLATELALKATLWLYETRGIRGHNIAELLQKAEVHVGRAPQNVQDAVDVLRVATAEIQYPDSAKRIPLHRFGEMDATLCVGAASEILRWIDEVIRRSTEETP
jgi:HEPN domain-containing protein